MKKLALAALAALMGNFVVAHAAPIDEASIARGGRLYDNWIREAKEQSPTQSHPGFANKPGVVTTVADTWRCTECHGWDYKGNHGFAGIRGRVGSDPAAIVTILKNVTHRYAELMRESDLLDLAKFVSRGQTDLKAAIESGRRGKTPDASSEKTFSTICAGCHGLDGTQLREAMPIGDSARQRPYEVLHVILYGHPGGAMPALSALGADVATRMLAYVQTLPSVNLPASIARGGRLYDDWQVEAGARRQSLPHPAYPATAYFAKDAQLTWRCKECHGFDYQGNQGDYASGNHATGIKGIRGMAGADPARIATILRDPKHQYGAVLKTRDLQDLANFVSAGQVDMNAAIDRQSRRIRGDAARGGGPYVTLCANCHGVDGQLIATRPLGRSVKTNPWGSLHTIVNGHPDEKMPALRELGMPLLLDILAHVQGFPESR